MIRTLRWLTAVLLAIAVFGARPAAAQQPRDELTDRELAYQAAEREYEAAVAAWRVVEKQWTDALQEHSQARTANDEARQSAALTRALDLSREVDSLERRVNERRGALTRARTGFLAAIDTRMRQLERQLAAARTTGERGRVAALIRDLENREAGLEGVTQAMTVRPALLYLPQIDFDPRDTPEDMVSKAQLLRANAQRADSLLAQIDEDIGRRERALRSSRSRESLVTGLDRFGDVQAPGAPVRRVPGVDERVPADSAGVPRPEATPEQRLQELQLLRFQTIEAKRQFLERAQLFEERARRIG